MSKVRFALVAVFAIGLTGCGSHDCNSGDVHETLLSLLAGDTSGMESMVENAFGVGPTAESLQAFAAGTVTEIVTLEKNKSTGAFVCNAKVTIPVSEDREVSLQMDYEVRQVESGDSDFQVLASKSDINRMRANVNGTINNHLRAKAEAERKEQRKQAFLDNPPIAMTDEEASAAIIEDMSRYNSSFAESSHAIVGQDFGGEGYKDYVIAYRSHLYGDTYGWSYKHYWSTAREPGEKVSLDGNSDQEITREHDLTSLQLHNGVVTFSDGNGWSQAAEIVTGKSYHSSKL